MADEMERRDLEVVPLPLEDRELSGLLEALVLAAPEPVSVETLARVVGRPPAAVAAALAALERRYREEGRGIRLQEHRGRWQWVTAPEASPFIRRLLGMTGGERLSRAALETLAIIAYHQPVTRAQVEAVRGVDCTGVLQTLLMRGLIEEVGRAEAPGRPILYGTTDRFLQTFGLRSLADLPPLPENGHRPEGDGDDGLAQGGA